MARKRIPHRHTTPQVKGATRQEQLAFNALRRALRIIREAEDPIWAATAALLEGIEKRRR